MTFNWRTDPDKLAEELDRAEQAPPKRRYDVQEIVDAVCAKVIGQDNAVRAIAELVSSRSWATNRKKGCFAVVLLVGRSGFGKTLIAQELAGILYPDSNPPLCKVNCGRLKNDISTGLWGAPPGYSGYDDDAGKVIRDFKANKGRCVYLLDEFEKAATSPKANIIDEHLGMMEDGFVEDSTGQSYSALETTIIITANLEQDAIAKAQEKLSGEALNNEVSRLLKKHWPDFFVNRLDLIFAIEDLKPIDRAKLVQLECVKLAFEHNIRIEDSAEGIDESVYLKAVKASKDMGSMRDLKYWIDKKIRPRLVAAVKLNAKTIRLQLHGDEFVAEPVEFWQ